MEDGKGTVHLITQKMQCPGDDVGDCAMSFIEGCSNDTSVCPNAGYHNRCDHCSFHHEKGRKDAH